MNKRVYAESAVKTKDQDTIEGSVAIKKTAAKTAGGPAKSAPAKTTAATSAPEKAPAAKLTKTQTIKAMAEKLQVEPKQVQAFFDLLVETATEQTRDAGEFTLPGLGKLVKAERKERMGRNPQTGEAIKIAAKTTVKFRIAKPAADAIAPPKA